MPRRALVPAVVVAFVAASLVAACGDTTADVVFGPEGIDGDDGGAFRDGMTLGDGAGPGYCQGAGPPVALPQGTCTGDVGKKTFLFAACACDGVAVSGALRTDSRSSIGAPTSGKTASIGSNGAVQTNARIDVGGSIWAASGSPAVRLADQGAVASDVRAGGALAIAGTFTVDGDAFASGGVDVQSGGLTIAGKLHVPSGGAPAGVTASGGVVNEPVSVIPPCNCDHPLDVAALVRTFAGANDDAAAGIAPSALAASAPHDVALPCGRYYFDALGGDVHLHVGARTAIFVGGDANVTSLQIDLGPQGEIDLFVAGSFALNGTFGSTGAPARVRIYVGGPTMTISGNVGLAANLYAPNADVQVASAFEMSGSIFAKRLAFAGDFTIHYDEAILQTPGCDEPGHACATCHDCAGATPACKNGACTACTADADCCAPLVCRSGECVPDVRPPR